VIYGIQESDKNQENISWQGCKMKKAGVSQLLLNE
jgi:hypothetical protein